MSLGEAWLCYMHLRTLNGQRFQLEVKLKKLLFTLRHDNRLQRQNLWCFIHGTPHHHGSCYNDSKDTLINSGLMSALVLPSLLLNRILYFQLDPFVFYHTVLTLSSVLNPDCYILKMLHNKIGHCNRVTERGRCGIGDPFSGIEADGVHRRTCG